MNDQFLIQFEGQTQMMTADDELHAARRVLHSREDLPGGSYEVRVVACPPFPEGTPFSAYQQAAAAGRIVIVDVAPVRPARGAVTARWAEQ